MAKCRDAQTDEICHCKTAITIRHTISPEMPKQISFDHVDLRDYRRIAGDNPSVTDGCTLVIGWEYNCHQPFTSMWSPCSLLLRSSIRS